MEYLHSFLEHIDSQGLYPQFHAISAGINEPISVIDDKEYLNFCANNYLGLTQHPKVKEAAQNAIEKYGVGPGGSPVISGLTDITQNLERRISVLTMTEDCLTFPTGYMANLAVFTALMDPLWGGDL